REVVTDAAALLERECGLAQMREDAVHRILDAAHHEAVEQGHVARGARAREDSSRGEEAVTREGFAEGLRPLAAMAGGFGLGGGERHARPAFGHVFFQGRAVRRFEPVLHVPDLAGDIAHSPSIPPKPFTNQLFSGFCDGGRGWGYPALRGSNPGTGT